jgi:hypothetical protein
MNCGKEKMGGSEAAWSKDYDLQNRLKEVWVIPVIACYDEFQR